MGPPFFATGLSNLTDFFLLFYLKERPKELRDELNEEPELTDEPTEYPLMDLFLPLKGERERELVLLGDLHVDFLPIKASCFSLDPKRLQLCLLEQCP